MTFKNRIDLLLKYLDMNPSSFSGWLEIPNSTFNEMITKDKTVFYEKTKKKFLEKGINTDWLLHGLGTIWTIDIQGAMIRDKIEEYQNRDSNRDVSDTKQQIKELREEIEKLEKMKYPKNVSSEKELRHFVGTYQAVSQREFHDFSKLEDDDFGEEGFNLSFILETGCVPLKMLQSVYELGYDIRSMVDKSIKSTKVKNESKIFNTTTTESTSNNN